MEAISRLNYMQQNKTGDRKTQCSSCHQTNTWHTTTFSSLFLILNSRVIHQCLSTLLEVTVVSTKEEIKWEVSLTNDRRWKQWKRDSSSSQNPQRTFIIIQNEIHHKTHNRDSSSSSYNPRSKLKLKVNPRSKLKTQSYRNVRSEAKTRESYRKLGEKEVTRQRR